MILRPPRPPLFPYTTLFRSNTLARGPSRSAAITASGARLRTPTSSIWRTRNIASRRSTNGAPSQDSTSSADAATPSSARCRQRGHGCVTPPPPPPPPPGAPAAPGRHPRYLLRPRGTRPPPPPPSPPPPP